MCPSQEDKASMNPLVGKLAYEALKKAGIVVTMDQIKQWLEKNEIVGDTDKLLIDLNLKKEDQGDDREKLDALKNSTPENPLYQESISDMHQQELMPHHWVGSMGDTLPEDPYPEDLLQGLPEGELGFKEKPLIEDVREFYNSMTKWDRDRDSMVDALNELKSLKDVKSDLVHSPEGEFYYKGNVNSSSIDLLNKLQNYREPPIQQYPASQYPGGPGKLTITPDRIPAREGIWMDVLKDFKENR